MDTAFGMEAFEKMTHSVAAASMPGNVRMAPNRKQAAAISRCSNSSTVRFRGARSASEPRSGMNAIATRLGTLVITPISPSPMPFSAYSFGASAGNDLAM